MTNTTTDERIRQIRDICEKRKIKELVHFTQLKNLDTILRFGLLGRKDLDRDRRFTGYAYNDYHRLDGYPNAVCLSISFPNYRMFYKYQRDNKGVDWVVLSLRPEILWELDCVFFSDNAASSEMRSEPLSVHKKAESLRAMFEDFKEIERPTYLPLSFPTNPQAEVLVFEKIPPSYITRVYFYRKQIRDRWLAEHPLGLGGINFSPRQLIVEENYFLWRYDFELWKDKGERASSTHLGHDFGKLPLF